jgi:hypothetical protein
VGEQVQGLITAGLDGFVFHLPNPFDLETLALAGETVCAAFSSRV